LLYSALRKNLSRFFIAHNGEEGVHAAGMHSTVVFRRLGKGRGNQFREGVLSGNWDIELLFGLGIGDIELLFGLGIGDIELLFGLGIEDIELFFSLITMRIVLVINFQNILYINASIYFFRCMVVMHEEEINLHAFCSLALN